MIRGYAPALRSYNAYMRRLAFIATFVLALNVPPVWAQMRSGPRVMGPPVRSGFAVRRPVFVGGGLRSATIQGSMFFSLRTHSFFIVAFSVLPFSLRSPSLCQ